MTCLGISEQASNLCQVITEGVANINFTYLCTLARSVSTKDQLLKLRAFFTVLSLEKPERTSTAKYKYVKVCPTLLPETKCLECPEYHYKFGESSSGGHVLLGIRGREASSSHWHWPYPHLSRLE